MTHQFSAVPVKTEKFPLAIGPRMFEQTQLDTLLSVDRLPGRDWKIVHRRTKSNAS